MLSVRYRKEVYLSLVDLVPKAGLEPARLAAGDFESPASTIPPLGPIDFVEFYTFLLTQSLLVGWIYVY